MATRADREAIRRLVNQAFVVERPLKRNGTERLEEADGELEGMLERGSFLLLEQEGKLVATVYLEPREPRCYLGLLSVDPARKGMGLGKEMHAAAESFARAWGCCWMDLRVVSPRREELVPLYTRLGYEESGTEEYPSMVQEKMAVPGVFIRMSKRLCQRKG